MDPRIRRFYAQEDAVAQRRAAVKRWVQGQGFADPPTGASRAIPSFTGSPYSAVQKSRLAGLGAAIDPVALFRGASQAALTRDVSRLATGVRIESEFTPTADVDLTQPSGQQGGGLFPWLLAQMKLKFTLMTSGGQVPIALWGEPQRNYFPLVAIGIAATGAAAGYGFAKFFIYLAKKAAR